jgi:aspartate racemase
MYLETENPTSEGPLTETTTARSTGAARPNQILPRLERNNVPLSFAQQRLWFIDQLSPKSPLYNFAVAWRMAGSLNQEALTRSLSAIVARHEVLRTRFVAIEGQPAQFISEPAPVELPVKDLTRMTSEAREAEVERLLSVEAARPFDLAQDLMMRCLLLKLGADEHVLVVTTHHIATDAWSAGIFLRELAIGYEASCAGVVIPQRTLPIQYADYALWQRQWLKGRVLDRQLDYWKEQLAGAKEFLDLPTDRPRPASPTHRGAVETRRIAGDTVQRLRQLSRQDRVTLFMVLLAAFKTLLYRYTRQEDILVGSPVAGRNRMETENNIGFFVNTLVLRTDFSGNPTFRELLARVREVVLGAFEHQDLPFEKLVAELHPERHTSQGPLIQVMFVLQHATLEKFTLGDLTLSPVQISQPTAKFDLTLLVEERENELIAGIEYNADLFDASTIARMAGHWEKLLAGIAANPESRLLELPLLTDQERHQIMVEWNRTDREYPRERCIHELFQDQARETPEATALTFGNQQLTYKELNARANQLAWRLKEAGAKPGDVVGFCAERSLEMVICLLGILKAGAAYAALDPTLPPERLAYMLEDLQAKILLTQHPILESWPEHSAGNGSMGLPQQICLDAEWDAIAQASTEDIPNEVTSQGMAYVSFTSGSTGRPKGVCVPHRGVVRLVRNTDYINFSTEDVFLQLAPISFDASTLEIWGSLLNGGRLVILPPGIPSLTELAETLERHGITTLFLTSGLFNQVVDERPGSLRRLRQLLTGGEVLSPSHAKKALDLLDTGTLIHVYGPTENTTFTTWYTIPRTFDWRHTVPIGRPIANTQCYILDERRQPVPIGVVGELYAGGDGLALGYLNQSELTAERFVPHILHKGERLYRTGDRVRYMPDGNIEFFGRWDSQVKIRGFRVELGEIETVLGRHPQVRQCAVVAHGDIARGKRLTAYIVANPGTEVAAGELRQFVKTKLPTYMVPTGFVRVESLPLLANGKVDRRALPVPEDLNIRGDKEFVRPGDTVETELAAIWENILGTHPIGMEDKFFEMGGHSLLAVRLVAQVEKKFGAKLPVSVVFQAPTIRGMAGYLRQEKSLVASSSVVEIQAKGSKPPLYLVHGVGGGMFWGYTNLARCLGTDQPVYALKSRAMDGEEKEFSKIEEMAAHYVADVRAVQPVGPYHLGGYCFGGNVAYEMARQLQAAGETVALLAVMNAAPPNSAYGRPRWTPAWWANFFINLGHLGIRSLSWSSRQRREFLRWKAALARRKVIRLFNFPQRAAQEIDVDDIVDLSTFPADQRKLWEAHIRALIDFFPKPYAGKVTLFRSRGHAVISSYDSRYGWGELAAEVEVHSVPGAHESILEEPHVAVLAEKLRDCVGRAEPSPTAKAETSTKSVAQVAETVREWNQTRAEYPRELGIHQLFEEQVRRTPGATAVIWAGEQLTYLELNRRANQIAHHLRSLGIGPDVPVGISLDRSVNQVVAMLGILKSGGAYVPLDPAYPRERLALMLEDAQAPVLLTQSTLTASMPVDGRRVACLDEAWPSDAPDTDPACCTTAESLAYVIYTSGSTGRPKGVAMTHGPLVNLICWQRKQSPLRTGDRTLQFSSLSFDVSFQEVFSTWCSGGVLVLIDEKVRHDAVALREYLREQKINRLFLPFIALNQLAESVKEDEPPPASLKEVITAGEQLRITPKITAFFGRLPDCTLHNHYGPTESHVVTSYTLHGPPDSWPSLPPIGRPISNTQIYILDENRKNVSVGEAGELYIGGDCLARGYLHRPDLTAERFICDSFEGGRLYKTGDVARYLPDGNIEYLGRADQQVKIRGYRVELGEIESVLERQDGVRECAVVAREDIPGQKRLVGYVVRQPGQEITTSSLRRSLQETLPEYMVPAAFVFLESLPVTPSGKVNRLGLPAPDQNRPELEEQFVAPANDAEERVATIWREVLNLKEVGTQDNFFDLGGNSLMVGQVISRVREAFQIELPAQALFDAPTIAALSKGMAAGNWGQERPGAPPIKRQEQDLHPPLSFAQRRLWFIDRLEPGSPAYNVPMAIHLEGHVNAAALQTSLKRIAQRHDSLRTAISFNGGNLSQAISAEAEIKMTRVDLNSWPAAERMERARKLVDDDARRPFNLEARPLWRCTLIRLDESEHILVVVMHHIISDGWSLDVLFRELSSLYCAESEGKCEPALPTLPVQYADYALWQQDWMRGPVLDRHISYWQNKLKDAPPTLELPLDHAMEPEAGAKCAQHSTILPSELVDSMASFGRREGVTPFMTMMAALAITLNRWTRQSDIVVGTVVAGRNRREIENLIGCFMNFLPVRCQPAEAKTNRAFLAQVKSSILEAQSNQECPFEKIVEAINPERRLAQNPLYNVAFLMQNFPATTLSGAGIKASPMAIESPAALLDLRFIAEDTSQGLSLTCEYKSELFDAETVRQLLASYCGVLAEMVRDPLKEISKFELTPELVAQAKAAKSAGDQQMIAVAATFTAEPVEESLKYWLRELRIPGRVEFAPYNQVFQQLLDPTSVFSTNRRGLNVVLVRFEDWQQFGHETAEETTGNGGDGIRRNVEEFARALKAATSLSAVPYLVCLCPPSKQVMQDPARSALYEQFEARLTTDLERMDGAYLVTAKDLQRLYPVAECHDARADELGSIPYTPVFFTAIGTMIARKFHALKRAPFKVIVLDCDETLWAGVCGEDGPNGIQLDPPRKALQDFMREQCENGMLLCLCSKNNEEDVFAVFERRCDMPLGRNHLAGWRINWLPKSENLKSLAGELRLGLDSFIFLDDNPVECAEVEASCPEVLALQLPESPEQLPQFLNHCWAFDRTKTSVEDQTRHLYYQQDRQREELRSQSLGLAEFLAGLELKVDIGALSEGHLARAAQLSQRTNQFNFTTHRRTVNDFQEMLRAKKPEALVVSVNDRLGAYGQVGVVVYEARNGSLDVETFLLSCRVLGRGVEHQIVAWLGRSALSRGLSRVDLHFNPSAKNQPAFLFLEKTGARFRQASNGGYLYRLPAKFAAGVSFNPDTEELPPLAGPRTAVNARPAAESGPSSENRFRRYRWIAMEANDPAGIYGKLASRSRTRGGQRQAYIAAQSEMEKLLCKIWEELLRIDRVGIDDNFFELGGHSLLAVRLFAEVEKVTGRKLPLVTLFQNATVKQLAEAVRHSRAVSRSSLVPIRGEGSLPPLFLIHGAGGDVLWGYANLAPYLGPEQPVYGVKSRALNGVDEFGSLEDMAAYYIEQLRRVQKSGPYYLGGYCFGGNVAFEMARQLHEAGERVALVALLDSAPSNAGYERMRWWSPDFWLRFGVNMLYWLDDFFKTKADERRAFVERKFRAWKRKLARKLRGGGGSEQVDLEEVIDTTKFPENELRLWQVHLDLLTQHVSRPYAGKVTLFRTRGQPLFCSLENDFGWGRLAKDGVEIKMVPGSHESVFMEPEVAQLAGQLKACLTTTAFGEKQEGPTPTIK